jgi:hypothetical protein
MAPLTILAISFVALGFSGFTIWEMFSEGMLVLSGMGLVLITGLLVFIIGVEKPDSIVSNACLSGAYMMHALKKFGLILVNLAEIERLKTHHVERTLIDSFNVKEILRMAMDYQKRASQYLSSFLLGGNSYNIEGFAGSGPLNMDALFASARMMILFLSLPVTKDEWPWVEKE